MAPHDRCALCGDVGSVAHRAFHCRGWQALRQRMLPTSTQAWLAEFVEDATPQVEAALAMAQFPLSM
eukprot:4503572-Amphidinium_carterae.1